MRSNQVVQGLALVAVVAVVAVGLWRLPIVLYPDLTPRDVAGLSVKNRLDAANDRANLQSSSRGSLAQALGGLLLLWGAVLAWTQFRQDIADRRLQREHDRELLWAEQFKSAVGFLASPEIDIRVAAVFSIGQIAEASEGYRGPAGQLLSTLVRTRSGWPPSPPRAEPEAPLEDLLELRIHAADVQAAIEVLGRHSFRWYGGEHFRFRYADLRRANLSGLHFEGAAFTEAHLERAWMRSGMLRYASFRGADLTAANLDGADLRDGNLRGAGLAEASLKDINVHGARFDETTVWPASYSEEDAVRGGAIKVARDDPPTSVTPIEVPVD